MASTTRALQISGSLRPFAPKDQLSYFQVCIRPGAFTWTVLSYCISTYTLTSKTLSSDIYFLGSVIFFVRTIGYFSVPVLSALS